MKEIAFITSNTGKFNAAYEMLKNCGILVVHKPLQLIEPRGHDPRDVVREKILQASEIYQQPLIVSDAGLFIYSLNNFPGTFTNFILETIGVEGLLMLLRGKNRKCEFRHCLGYWEPELTEPSYFERSYLGEIAIEPKGKIQDYHWSELASIFIPDGQSRTLAEMTREEYSTWRLTTQIEFERFGEWFKTREGK